MLKRKNFCAKEILTGYSNLDLYNRSLLKDGFLNSYYKNEKRYQDTGYHLVVLEDDFISKREVSLKELNDYVEDYDNSLWKKIYDEMKIIKKEEKNKIKNRVKEVLESKK
ncbi:MAG: hypothetical protein IKE70_00020 [Bacilli bacterium]|nr:hypothetical protein [Bacilli bacterium]